MGKASKEENTLELFFEEPTKHWHFTEIQQKINIADNKVSRWLKKFMNQKLIIKTKPKNKMPYYTSNYENPEYQNRKRIYALKKLHETGFLNHLLTLQKAKTIIIFGSLTRWDWHKKSDVDLFIYGEDDELEQGKYEQILKREIQVFTFKNFNELKKINKELMKNIIKGDLIKGDLTFLEVKASA